MLLRKYTILGNIYYSNLSKNIIFSNFIACCYHYQIDTTYFSKHKQTLEQTKLFIAKNPKLYTTLIEKIKQVIK